MTELPTAEMRERLVKLAQYTSAPTRTALLTALNAVDAVERIKAVLVINGACDGYLGSAEEAWNDGWATALATVQDALTGAAHG